MEGVRDRNAEFVKTTTKINDGKLFNVQKLKGGKKITLSHILIFIGTICTYLSVDERGGTRETDH